MKKKFSKTNLEEPYRKKASQEDECLEGNHFSGQPWEEIHVSNLKERNECDNLLSKKFFLKRKKADYRGR
jgi:hypothetical protein